MKEVLPFFCGRDCGGDACPLLVEKEDGRVVRVRQNPLAGPFIRGCAKGYAVPQFHYSPQRIKTPLMRVGERGSGIFREASWAEALELVARKLSETVSGHGASSILNLSSAGCTGALHGTHALSARFLGLLGDYTALSGNYSCAAAMYALERVFGADFPYSGFDPATIEDSKLVILLGANIFEARLGAELPSMLLKIAKKGTPIVYIDPRRTKTAQALGAHWIPIRPGTDLALLYAVLNYWKENKLLEENAVIARSVGFESLIEHVRGASDGIPKTPEWAQSITGIPKREIEILAEQWMHTKPTMLIPGYSIQRTEYGEETMRLCVALQLASRNLGVCGGSSGSLNNRLPAPRIKTLSPSRKNVGPKIPIVRWPDAVLCGEPEYPSTIRFIYSVGGNLLNQGADAQKSIAAFCKTDFIVCHEMFMTPTARFSDVVLPVASPLQKEDIGIPWAGNYLLYKPKILPYTGMERSDYDIFCDLASKLGLENLFSEGRTESEWVDYFIANSCIADGQEFKRTGIFTSSTEGNTRISDFSQDPQKFPLATASGKLELGGQHHSAFTSNEGSQLLLITPKVASRVHSQCGDYPHSCHTNTLIINPATAKSLGLFDGELAVVHSLTGEMCIPVKFDASIREGVVSASEGTWLFASEFSLAPRTSMVDGVHTTPNPEPEVATVSGSMVKEVFNSGSANLLTATDGTAESHACIMEGIPVTIAKFQPSSN